MPIKKPVSKNVLSWLARRSVQPFLLVSSPMDKLALVQAALRTISNPSPARVSVFIAKKHGVLIEPRFIPVFVATLRDRERLEVVRRAG